MRLAIIDVGTNSTRLLLCEVERKAVKEIFKTGKLTRLGEGLFEKGLLSPVAVERTVKAIEEFLEKAKEFKPDKIIVVATEAVRRAKNPEDFLKKAEKLGVSVRVISDEEEGRLVYLANVIDENPLITVDLGGGSTEIVYGKGRKIEFVKSLKFGVVSLKERFLHHDPPSESELKELETYLEKELSELARRVSEEFEVVAVGGTITSVVAMEKEMEIYKPEEVHGSKVCLETIEKWYKKLTSMNSEERKRIKGLEEKRVDVIVPGLAFFKVFLEVFRKNCLTVSEKGLLFGLALEESKRLN